MLAESKQNFLADLFVASMHVVASYQAAEGLFAAWAADPRNGGE